MFPIVNLVLIIYFRLPALDAWETAKRNLQALANNKNDSVTNNQTQKDVSMPQLMNGGIDASMNAVFNHQQMMMQQQQQQQPSWYVQS